MPPRLALLQSFKFPSNQPPRLCPHQYQRSPRSYLPNPPRPLLTPSDHSPYSFNTTMSITSKVSGSSDGPTPIFTNEACPPAGPYSQGVKAASQIWVAGQIPADSEGKLLEGSMAEKTAQCCRNIKAVLEAGGSGLEKVVRVGVSSFTVFFSLRHLCCSVWGMLCFFPLFPLFFPFYCF